MDIKLCGCIAWTTSAAHLGDLPRVDEILNVRPSEFVPPIDEDAGQIAALAVREDAADANVQKSGRFLGIE